MEILSLRPPPFERDEIKKAQRRRYYASVSMNESTMTNVLTTQLGTSCSFDSPGLASVASYPGLICCVGGQRHRCSAF